MNKEIENIKSRFKYNDILKEYSDLKSKYQSLSLKYAYNMKYQENIINTRNKDNNVLLKKEYNLIIKNMGQTIKQIKKDSDLKIAQLIKKYDDIILELKNENEALKKEVAKLVSILDNDSTNSGIPSSQTPINKNKPISNSRKKTGKKPGGQKGRKKYKLNAFSDEEATEVVNVVPKECPHCGNDNIVELDTSTDKCVTDYIVKVEKIKYKYKDCFCDKCNKNFREKISYDLKEENQYGNNIKALALCLTNEIYTPFNKTVKLIDGITKGEIRPSEGYIAKLQRKYGKNLEEFIKNLKVYFPKQEVYGWDDTTIMINGSRSVLRVYCTDKVSLFFAHPNKNKTSIDEDGILSSTPSNAIVMHDHLTVNYNDDYNFQNVECLIHLIRRLKKMQEKTRHKWSIELKELLSQTNMERNKLIEKEETSFNKQYLDNILNKYDELLNKGLNENHEDTNNYFQDTELRLIKDLEKYKENYLLWVFNFNIPSTNNTSERNVRPTKSKMKISGQFKNISFARFHAILRSYIETCKRNNINIMEACNRLVNNNPYTLDEILNHAKKD